MQEYAMRILLTFDTTHHALWAEEIARDEAVPSEVVPAPAEAHARCNLALELFVADLDRMKTALQLAGVPFAVHRVG